MRVQHVNVSLVHKRLHANSTLSKATSMRQGHAWMHQSPRLITPGSRTSSTRGALIPSTSHEISLLLFSTDDDAEAADGITPRP